MSLKQNNYKQTIGSIETLSKFPHNSFDLIICHNVLEYVDNKDEYILAFSKLLKVGGKISLIKHNRAGRIMQKAIFENDIEQALQLINGETTYAKNFGEIKYYCLSEINRWVDAYNLKIDEILGVRTFFALHPDNTIRYNDDWLNSMFELEIKASRIKAFIDIAFFNHVILEKV